MLWRRKLIAKYLRILCITIAAARSIGAQPTAAQIVDRIKANAGVTVSDRTVDTFKAGDPNVPVKGVAVVMMATLDALKEASRRNLNFIITHEPTFSTSRDTLAILESENDSVIALKQKFIKDHGLVIWRFHDTPHAMHPDMVRLGMVKALGWEKKAIDSTLITFDIAPTKISDLRTFLASRLSANAIRIAGNPSALVKRVALTEGFPGFAANRHAIQPGIDALVMGEDHEWETIEYANDEISEGRLKAVIVLGHIASEQEGMREAAKWISTFVKEVPVQYVPTPPLLKY